MSLGVGLGGIDPELTDSYRMMTIDCPYRITISQSFGKSVVQCPNGDNGNPGVRHSLQQHMAASALNRERWLCNHARSCTVWQLNSEADNGPR
jgi:hypothetical protein